MSTRPLADAVLAVTTLFTVIFSEVVWAEHGCESRVAKQRRLETAIAKARELVTRLEVARDLYAASPLDRSPPAPVDSGAWTGREAVHK